jgi:SAM-dependent methyltransferase
MTLETLYTSGSYLEKNPSWHVEESPWKASQVLRMLARNGLHPRKICEVGCGVGEILRQLQGQMDDLCQFWGYDISPQAIELAQSRANERLRFALGDVRLDRSIAFDLVLLMDVIEHLEDPFDFLRTLTSTGERFILHIPLDLSVQTILRRRGLLYVREAYGHLHYYSKELALQMLKDAGYDVLDYFYTARALEQPTHMVRRKLLRLPRKWLYALSPDVAARVLGGWSLLVLCASPNSPFAVSPAQVQAAW